MRNVVSFMLITDRLLQMDSNEHTISDLLKLAYRRLHVEAAVSELEVRDAYRDVAGSLIYKLTRSVRFKEGELVVVIASAALRHEMEYRKDSLMDKINKRLGNDIVKTIKIILS